MFQQIHLFDKQVLPKLVFIFLLLIGNPFNTFSQTHIGLETGANMSSVTPVRTFEYSFTLGGQVGVWVEQELNRLVAIRGGVYYELTRLNFGKPLVYAPNQYLDLHSISLPVLTIMKPIKEIQIGIGTECNIIAGSSSKGILLPSFNLGIRGELAYQMGKNFRMAVYCVCDLLGVTAISVGANFSYKIHTIEKKEKIQLDV